MSHFIRRRGCDRRQAIRQVRAFIRACISLHNTHLRSAHLRETPPTQYQATHLASLPLPRLAICGIRPNADQRVLSLMEKRHTFAILYRLPRQAHRRAEWEDAVKFSSLVPS